MSSGKNKSARASKGAVPATPEAKVRPRFGGTIVPMMLIFGAVMFYGGHMRAVVTTQDELAQQEWTVMEKALQRRSDAAERFVDVVQKYAAEADNAEPADAASENGEVEQEEGDSLDDVLDALKLASVQLSRAKSPTSGANADVALSVALGRTLGAVKELPGLREKEEYVALLDELSAAESAITDSRVRYNGIILEANRLLVGFPGKFVAPLFKLEPREYFNAFMDLDGKKTTVVGASPASPISAP